MQPTVKTRLSVMMFLQYFVWGAWYVSLGTWLATRLRFNGEHIGLTAGTTAIGAIISPFFMGLIADRWLATQRLLGLLHLIGAVLLVAASNQTSFPAVYASILTYSLCYMPTLALSNSLAFRHMRDPQQQFGPVRVFGTIGWTVAGLIVGYWGIEATRIPMRVAAGCSLLLGIYAFTLPETHPLAAREPFQFRQLVPMQALLLFRQRSMAIFALSLAVRAGCRRFRACRNGWGDGPRNWRAIWTFAGTCSAAVLLLFLAVFTERRQSKSAQDIAVEPPFRAAP